MHELVILNCYGGEHGLVKNFPGKGASVLLKKPSPQLREGLGDVFAQAFTEGLPYAPDPYTPSIQFPGDPYYLEALKQQLDMTTIGGITLITALRRIIAGLE